MGHYIRFFQTDEPPLTLAEAEQALRTIDGEYSVDRDGPSDAQGVLLHKGDLYAELEVNVRGDDLADDEIEEFREKVEQAEAAQPNKAMILATLDATRTILAIRVLWQARTTEATFKKIEPLCDWLLDNHAGVLHVDEVGFEDKEGLILEVP